jgi:hypothetical protein
MAFAPGLRASLAIRDRAGAGVGQPKWYEYLQIAQTVPERASTQSYVRYKSDKLQ